MATDDDALLDQLRQLLRDDRKIEAIRLYREQTGAGLKEAKDAVEAVERGEALELSDASSVEEEAAPESGSLEAQIVALLGQGQFVQAVKLYRSRTGSGLKVSKEAVEVVARRNGIPVEAGCLGMLLFAGGLGWGMWQLVGF